MKNVVYRKSKKLINRVPRRINGLQAKEEDYQLCPPILANSFPKSGTHLLTQILSAIPGYQNYGAFIATTPTIPFQEREPSFLKRMLSQSIPSELVSAHLYYNEEYHSIIEEKNIVHYFIYRDPRDVVVSESHYLTHMNRWHRLHKYFKALPTDEDRISFSILGAKENFPYPYPNIQKRFARYQEWILHENVFPVRFEDLISEKREDIIREMMRFYMSKTSLQYYEDELVQSAIENISPEKSHTFRSGKAGGWKNIFTDQHKREMKHVAGELLVELGYEQNSDW